MYFFHSTQAPQTQTTDSPITRQSPRKRTRRRNCPCCDQPGTTHKATSPAVDKGTKQKQNVTPPAVQKRPVGRPRKTPKTPEDKAKRPVGRPKKEKFDITAERDAPGMIGEKPRMCKHGGAVYEVPLVKRESIPSRFTRNDVSEKDYIDFKKLKGQNVKGRSSLDLNSTLFNLEDTEIYDSSSDDGVEDAEKDPENVRFFQDWVYHGRNHGRGGGVAGSTKGRVKSTGKAYWTKGMLNTLGLAINGERDALRGRSVSGASKKMYHPTRTFCWDRVAGMCMM